MMQATEPTRPKGTFYQITISGRLDAERSAWFDGLDIQYQDGATVLAGRLVDPEALFGIIERIRDLGLKLIEVRQNENE